MIGHHDHDEEIRDEERKTMDSIFGKVSRATSSSGFTDKLQAFLVEEPLKEVTGSPALLSVVSSLVSSVDHAVVSAIGSPIVVPPVIGKTLSSVVSHLSSESAKWSYITPALLR